MTDALALQFYQLQLNMERCYFYLSHCWVMVEEVVGNLQLVPQSVEELDHLVP